MQFAAQGFEDGESELMQIQNCRKVLSVDDWQTAVTEPQLYKICMFAVEI
jgi:hypothetical protein